MPRIDGSRLLYATLLTLVAIVVGVAMLGTFGIDYAIVAYALFCCVVAAVYQVIA